MPNILDSTGDPIPPRIPWWRRAFVAVQQRHVAIAAALALLTGVITNLTQLWRFVPPMTTDNGECIGVQIHYKDFFHTIPDFHPLPYTFLCQPEAVSMFAPSDTGIAVHFQFQKANALQWAQVIDAEVEVHSFRPLPSLVKPLVPYPGGLQPYILVVPLQPRSGTYKTKVIYTPLKLDVVDFSRPTHRPLRVESMSTNPIEVREDSPQPFVVLATATAEGVYEMSITFRVSSSRGVQLFPLGGRREYAFVTENTVEESIRKWDALSAEQKDFVSKDRIRFSMDEQ